MAIEVVVKQFTPDMDLPIRTTTVRHSDDSIIDPRRHLEACSHHAADYAEVHVTFPREGTSTFEFTRGSSSGRWVAVQKPWAKFRAQSAAAFNDEINK